MVGERKVREGKGIVYRGGAKKCRSHAVQIAVGKEGHQKYGKDEYCGDMLLDIENVLKQQAYTKGADQRDHRNQAVLNVLPGIHCGSTSLPDTDYYTTDSGKETANSKIFGKVFLQKSPS